MILYYYKNIIIHINKEIIFKKLFQQKSNSLYFFLRIFFNSFQEFSYNVSYYIRSRIAKKQSRMINKTKYIAYL